ncbi:MAG: plasmid pRiA4b ORF-3 family protein [Brumimicrobium sp.]|nr:plasmid pRiA4b ORF-3 family protein [Brumimicrobium sp.]
MAGLKFRILLDSISTTEIFREILVNEDHTFEEFYTSLLQAFDLPNDQMASFYVSNDDWDKGEEITLMDMSFDTKENEESPQEMRDIQIKDKIESLNQRFILVYDFLKMWIFLIELSGVTKDNVVSPKVLMKVGEIPDKNKKHGPQTMNEMNFDTDYNPQDDLEFGDDFDDDFDNDFEDGYDDMDLGGYDEYDF